MHPNIGLLDKQREGVVAILNTVLADEYLLYTKTRNYHWNVVGPAILMTFTSSVRRSITNSMRSLMTWLSGRAH